jgi:hypothetical protein
MNQALYAHMNNKRKMKNKNKITSSRKKKKNQKINRTINKFGKALG